MLQIFFESLGCDKNLVDSEKMIGLLSRTGHSFTDDEREADVIVVLVRHSAFKGLVGRNPAARILNFCDLEVA